MLMEEFKRIVEELSSSKSSTSPSSAERLINAVREIVSESTPMNVSKPFAKQEFPRAIAKIKSMNVVKPVAEGMLQVIQTRFGQFEEADALIREEYAKRIQDDEQDPDFAEAARILSKINVANGRYSDTERAGHNVKIAELFLEVDDTVEADIYVNRASEFMFTCVDPNIRARYNVCYARILDSKRRFLDAASRYYELSKVTQLATNSMETDEAPQFVSEEDLMHILSKAVTCAILANAGAQRSRVIGMLYNDERVKTLQILYPIVEKIQYGRLIKSEDVVPFEKTLETHQKAILADGSSVLERALHEHNVLAIAKMFVNISIKDLVYLLEIDETRAEEIVSRMIRDGRLLAQIDQVDRIVDFSQSSDRETIALDNQIIAFCSDVNDFASKAQERMNDNVSF